MFIKFLDHDLRYGIGRAKKRLIVTFIMFFFLSIYHFWTLRIFELTDPQYLESPVTTADYFLALIGGCGKVNLISGAENDFVMPTMWFVFVLWMQFTSLYYPFAELNGINNSRRRTRRPCGRLRPASFLFACSYAFRTQY